jgi:hypothetical protein
MPLAEDDHMVKAFPAERASQPFRMPVLPWRTRRNWPVPNAHGPKAPGENFAVNRVTIPNDILGRPVPAEGLCKLPGHTFGRWTYRHSEPQDLAPAMPKNQRAIEQPNPKGRYDEEIPCSNPAGVVAQEGLPPLRWRSLCLAIYLVTEV